MTRKSTTPRPTKPAKARPPLDSTTLGKAILSLADLAVIHLSANQRGQTALANKDAELLGDIVEALAKHRDADPIASIGRKKSTLTADMQALGWIRRAFDDLFTYAAREWEKEYNNKKDELTSSDKDRREAARREFAEFEAERDEVLAGHLLVPFLNTRFQITGDIIRQAMESMKASAARKSRRENDKDDNGNFDWIKFASPSDERRSPISAAGELLQAVIELSPIRNEIEVGTRRQSTTDYKNKTIAAIGANTVRAVTALERLNYLMTVLGVPLDEAPMISFQASKLLAGEQLLGRSIDDTFTFSTPAPRPPTAFRVLDQGQQKPVMEKTRQALLKAGVPEQLLVFHGSFFNTNQPWAIVDSFLPSTTNAAGGEIGPSEDPILPWPNPWPEASAKQHSARVEALVMKGIPPPDERDE